MSQKRSDALQETRDGRIYRGSEATLWVCHQTGDVVVTGDPRSVEPEGCSEEDGHNCDAAGCRSAHVLARGRVVGIQLPPLDPRLREACGRLFETQPGSSAFFNVAREIRAMLGEVAP